MGGSCGEGRKGKGREEGLGPEGFWLSTVASTAEVLPTSWNLLEERLGPLASLSLGADLVSPVEESQCLSVNTRPLPGAARTSEGKKLRNSKHL